MTKKISAKKNGSARTTAGGAPVKKKKITIEVDGPYVLLRWKPYLDMYQDIRALEFDSDEEIGKAFDLLGTPDLWELPFDIGVRPGHGAIFVPAEAVPYFQHLNCRESKVGSPSDLTPEELRERPEF